MIGTVTQRFKYKLPGDDNIYAREYYAMADAPATYPRCGKLELDYALCGNRVVCKVCGKPYVAANDLPYGCIKPDCDCETKAFWAAANNGGWRCPACQRVFSPNTKECNYCNER